MEIRTFGESKIGNRTINVDSLYDIADKRQWDHDFSGYKLATVFLTQSIRTRLSFEAAAHELNMNVMTVTERRDGEPLRDFGYAMSQFADVIVARLPEDDDFRLFCQDIPTGVPVIDGGSGRMYHPTQALADVYTLKSHFDPGSKVCLFGSTTGNRAMRSFCELAGRAYRVMDYERNNDWLYQCDVVYCTTAGTSRSLPHDIRCKIMHPFPRGSVVPHSFDFTAQDLYHEQMQNLIKIRKEILCAVL